MKGIRLGRLFGIEVAIHPSWFLVLAFFAFTLANGFFPSAYPGWSPVASWTAAIIATLLLFASVLGARVRPLAGRPIAGHPGAQHHLVRPGWRLATGT